MQVEVVELDQSLTENFIRFCCYQLDINPSLITIEGWDEPFKNGALGLCYEVNTDLEYLIMVSKNGRNATEIYNTIAHEMIHVKQYMKQDLGNFIGAHKPAYNDRWWEIEAKKKSLHLVKKYVDNLYSMG
jgi:hypothetical protein